jgi:hypothetical protein
LEYSRRANEEMPITKAALADRPVRMSRAKAVETDDKKYFFFPRSLNAYGILRGFITFGPWIDV